jgi:hypothetical protein
MLREGDHRPLWLTEMGIQLGPEVDESRQASYLRQAFSLVGGWPYVRGAIWYELFDDPTAHDGQHFGLFDGSLQPRLAAEAFRDRPLQ